MVSTAARRHRASQRVAARARWLAHPAHLRQAASGARRVLPSGSSEHHVALTFDDGPDAVWTPRVLDVLADAGATATFFCVGERARRHPEVVRRILAEGHALGSHSLSHPAPGRLGALALQRDVRAGRRALEEVSGRPVRLYRPPHGHLPWAAVAAARAAAVRPWLWSCDSEDWRPDATADEIVEAATTLVARDVVLLHDALHSPDPSASTDRSATVEALPRIIEVLRARGLDFAPLRTTEPG